MAGRTLTFCTLLLGLGYASAFNLSVGDLPVPLQPSRRILAAITSVRHSIFIEKQLLNYVSMCEDGFEVHVVLVTLQNVWSSYEPGSMYHCSRREQVLPVAVSTYTTQLAARHREVFSQKKDMYDYFISQEDDMDIRLRHITYFIHWMNKLSGTNIIPAFSRVEVQMKLPNITEMHPQLTTNFTAPSKEQATRLSWHQPLIHLQMTDPITIFEKDNITYVAPFKVYPGFYIITRDILLEAVAKKSWTSDIGKPWREFNTHFQHHWLMKYKAMAIPYDQYRRSLVHHGSDKYTPQHVARSLNFTDRENHGFAVEVSELQFLMQECLGRNASWQSQTHVVHPVLHPNKTRIHYASPDPALRVAPAPCAVCLQQGLSAHFQPSFKGPCPSATPHKEEGLIYVDIKCMDGIPQQMLEPCNGTPEVCIDD